MTKLIGQSPDQVPTNADLGTMAYQDKDNVKVGSFTSNGIDDNATSTAMTLDSSGNLLVGKTSDDINVAGHQFLSGNAAAFTRAGGVVSYMTRNSSDGEILRFRKDTTTVGSIKSAGGTIRIDSGTAYSGLGFDLATIYPRQAEANSDAAIDLGYSSNRFKDLYLSGGVYLGGTGSANKLDDYEEGTWTPTIKFGNNNAGQAYQIQNGYYTKVGRLVTFTLRVQFSNKGTSTGNAQIYGLPFSMQNVFGANTGAYFGFIDNAGANWGSNNLTPTIDNGGNVINLRYVNTSGSYANFGHADFNNTTDLIMGGQIFTS